MTESGFDKIIKAKSCGKSYFIHDGPPYANNEAHLGHLVNKKIKLFFFYLAYMLGYETEFIAGWDCHGLPIEVACHGKELHLTNTSITEFKENCLLHAEKFIEIQKASFQSLGMLSFNVYKTLDVNYYKHVIAAIGTLTKNGYIGVKFAPVLWSTNEQTTLSYAEIEYKSVSTESLWFSFTLFQKNSRLHGYQIIVWTTQIWTIPLNAFVCISPDKLYVIFQMHIVQHSQKFICAAFALEKIGQLFGDSITVIEYIKGEDLLKECQTYINIFSLGLKKIVASSIVIDTGSGFVSCAPAHGKEDFAVFDSVFNEKVICYVDNFGKFTANFLGLSLLGTSIFAKETISQIKHQILSNDLLAKSEIIQHQYPHSWRSGCKLFFLLQEQVIFKIDHKQLKDRVLQLMEDVIVKPVADRNTLCKMLKERDDWCISRQRKWGIPLIVAFDDNYEIIYDEDFYKAAIDYCDIDRMDFTSFIELWSKILNQQASKNINIRAFVLDIWFESGCSFFVIPEKYINGNIMYFEGVDQCRGWFNSSAFIAAAITNKVPFTHLGIHGYVLDDSGIKMSKSQGNVARAEDVLKTIGPDKIGLIVISLDIGKDYKITENVVYVANKYFNKFCKLIEYVKNFINSENIVPCLNDPLIQFVKHSCYEMFLTAHSTLQTINLNTYYKNFTNLLDSCYRIVDILKPILFGQKDVNVYAIAVQTCFYIVSNLVFFAQPIFTFTCINLLDSLAWMGVESFVCQTVVEKSNFNIVLEFRALIGSAIDKSVKSKKIKNTQEAILFIKDPIEYQSIVPIHLALNVGAVIFEEPDFEAIHDEERFSIYANVSASMMV